MPRFSAQAGAEGRGLVLCLVAAVAFGAGAVVGATALGAGIDLLVFLTARFGLAAVALWALVLRSGARPSWRTAIAGLLLGAVLFAPESGLFFASLGRIDASLAALVVYVYPGLVAVAAVATGRERLTVRQVGSLVVASAGVAIVLAGAGAGAVDPLGVALALGAAVAYAGYVLAGDRVVAAADPLALAALVCTGAAVAFAGGWGAGGAPAPGGTPLAWALVGLMALGCTVVPMAALLGGVRRVGPSTASIVATAEPLVTATLAMLVVGDRLAPVQWLGAALVVGAVLCLRAPSRASAPVPVGDAA
jgi:drug/metabolite transporter (DMT)-like permease